MTTIRAAARQYAAAVLELCAASLLPRDSDDAAGLAQLLWDSPEVLGAVAEQAGTLQGAVFYSLGVEDAAPSGHLTLIAVLPEHRRRGVGSALLAWAEDRMTAAGARVVWTGGGAPRFWWSGIPSESAEAVGFFRAHGYQPADGTVDMRVDLEAADLSENPAAAGLIRRLGPQDWAGFREWMEQTWGIAWAAEVERVRDRRPVSCFIAEQEGRIVGFAAYDTNRAGLFGPMGTSPDVRGTGLGAELLRSCLRDYRAAGLTRCDIGWVGPLEFYARTVGARVCSRFVRLRRPLPIGP